MNNELQNLLDAIERADTFDQPYFHMHVENVFSDNFYKEIIKNIPDRSLFIQSTVRMGQIGKRHLFMIDEQFPEFPFDKITPFFQDFSRIFKSDDLKNAIFKKLKVRKKACYPQLQVNMDRASYQILPHPDTPTKIITMQFPLPNDDNYLHEGTKLLSFENGIYYKVKCFEYKANTLYGFQRTDTSFHCVDPTVNNERLNLLLNYYIEGLGPGYNEAYRR